MTPARLEHLPTGTRVRAADLLSLRRLGDAAAPLFARREAALGDRVARARGQGMDYAESRQYSPGDDIRHMDWPVTARTGEPHTKVFQVERGRETVVIADLRASMRFGTRSAFKSVVAAHVTALAGWAATTTGDRFGLVAIGRAVHEQPPGEARNTVAAACRVMETADEVIEGTGDPRGDSAGQEEPALVDAARAATERGSRGAEFLVLSDFHDDPEALQRCVLTLTSRGTVTLARITDAFEVTPPRRGRLGFASRDTVRVLDLAAESVQREHRDFHSARSAALLRLCALPGVTSRELRTGHGLLAELAASNPMSLPGRRASPVRRTTGPATP